MINTISRLELHIGVDRLVIRQKAKDLKIKIDDKNRVQIKDARKIIKWFSKNDKDSKVYDKTGYYTISEASKKSGLCRHSINHFIRRNSKVKVFYFRSVIHINQKGYDYIIKGMGVGRTDIVAIKDIQHKFDCSYPRVYAYIERLEMEMVRYLNVNYMLKEDVKQLQQAIKKGMQPRLDYDEIEGYYNLYRLVDMLGIDYVRLRHQIVTRGIIEFKRINRRIYIAVDKLDELKYKLGIDRTDIVSLEDVCETIGVKLSTLRRYYISNTDVEVHYILNKYYIFKTDVDKILNYRRDKAKHDKKHNLSIEPKESNLLQEFIYMKSNAKQIGVPKKYINAITIDTENLDSIAEGMQELSKLISKAIKDREDKEQQEIVNTEIDNEKRLQMRSALLNSKQLIVYPNFFLDAGDEHITSTLNELGLSFKWVESRPTSVSNVMGGYLLEPYDFREFENLRNSL